MRYVSVIVFFFIAWTFGGCSAVQQSHILSQLTTIRDIQSQILKAGDVGAIERIELNNSKELLRATFVGVRVGFGRDRNGEFALEEFERASLPKSLSGTGFFYLFENPKEYVLISNLFVPHVGDFNPTEFMQRTEGCYVLHVTKAPRLKDEIDRKMTALGNMASGDDGHGTTSSSDLESLARQGILAQAISYDASRVDIVEFVRSGRRITRYVINPIRPVEPAGQYRDDYTKIVDEIYMAIWKYFM